MDPAKGPRTVEVALKGRERGGGGQGVFHPDFMPFQEDAFTQGLRIKLVAE